MKLLVAFIYVLPNEYAGFFTAFRMTYQKVFGKSKNTDLVIQSQISILISQYSILSVRGILHCVQNDIPRGVFVILQGSPSFFVILNELLGEEESLP